jgi:SEC-C motif domain protein
MRSRYSAYVVGATGYLRETWEPSTCPDYFDAVPSAKGAPVWLGLQILRFTELDETHAEVEFVARFKADGRTQTLHESSRFTRSDDGRWRYVDGDLRK